MIILRTCDFDSLRFSWFRKYSDDFSPNSYEYNSERIILPAVIYRVSKKMYLYLCIVRLKSNARLSKFDLFLKENSET